MKYDSLSRAFRFRTGVAYTVALVVMAIEIGASCETVKKTTNQSNIPAPDGFFMIGGPSTLLSVVPNLPPGSCTAIPLPIGAPYNQQIDRGNLGDLAVVSFAGGSSYLYITQFPQSSPGNSFGLGTEVIDVNNPNAPVAIIQGSIQPFGSKIVISPRGHYAYVYALPVVEKIDITTQTLVASYTVPLPPPGVPILGGDMALVVRSGTTDANDEIWIAEPDPQDVVVFLSASNGQGLSSPVPVQNPLSMVSSTQGASQGNIYVSTTSGITVINAATHLIESNLSIPLAPQGYLALSADGNLMSSLGLYTNSPFTRYEINFKQNPIIVNAMEAYTYPFGIAYHNDPRVPNRPMVSTAANLTCPDQTLASPGLDATYGYLPVVPVIVPTSPNQTPVTVTVQPNPSGLSLLFDSSAPTQVFTGPRTFTVQAGTSHVATVYPASQTNPLNPAQTCTLQNWSDGNTSYPYYFNAPLSGSLTLTANFICQ